MRVPRRNQGAGTLIIKLKEVSKMPFGDRTGPMGMGPMTGRAAGYCAGYPVPGFMNPNPGRWGWGRGWGRGMGWGRGRGWGRRAYGGYPYPGYGGWGYPGWGAPAGGYPPGAPMSAPTPPTAEQEKQYLRDHADFLQKELEEIERRISDLESKPEEK